MGRKKKVVEESQIKGDKPTSDKPEPRVFEYGDLVVVCKCGRVQIVQKGIKHGLQAAIMTREDSGIQLICDECGSSLKLCFIEGEKPLDEKEEEKLEVKVTESENETTVEHKKEDEGIQEESEQE